MKTSNFHWKKLIAVNAESPYETSSSKNISVKILIDHVNQIFKNKETTQ